MPEDKPSSARLEKYYSRIAKTFPRTEKAEEEHPGSRMETRKMSIAGATARADSEVHKKAIERLTLDNQKLVQELALESKQDNMVNNSAASAEIRRLQDQGDAYTRKIELERRRIAELEKQITIVQDKVHAQRKKMGGANVSKQNNQVLAKQIRVLENRLDKATVRYNEILGKNKLIKEKIDDLRRERVIFDGIYKKLEKEMHSEKKEMARLVQECNRAYMERDEVKQEISKLKVQAEKEEEAFQAEWKRLGDLIEQDKRAKDLNQLPAEGPSKTDSTDSKKLKRQMAEGAWALGKDKAQLKISQEKAQNYEEMFNKIEEETGISDTDELVRRFVDGEEKNFELFSQINDLTKQIEELEQKVAGVETEVEKYRGQGANSENQRKRILHELEERLQSTNQKADQYEQRQAHAQRVLQHLKVGIQSICERLSADGNSSVREVLGTEGVTDSNVMQYLGVIEQRATEIMQLYTVDPEVGTVMENSAPLAALAAVSEGATGGGATSDTNSPRSGKGSSRSACKPSVKDLDAAQEQLEAHANVGLAQQSDAGTERPLTRAEIEKSVQAHLGPGCTANKKDNGNGCSSGESDAV
ncbi:Coiled-coil domain-containing protein 63 [Hondaea fermentalgiana]|uniref:Coiled-coil domain-containing protein 63 n=1 Tax=Hondaea fermentalgiana TaxID=2315210 RepID=A0A2R5GGQ1_9STRA|nr:Coiled-coil domain-containing protein 63 [Hondaea fermentalgiana]|eukprot:GBG30062.1 Coiled-coil domain-containing protein 63 [Hondaea fermentalgiana]